MSLDLCQVKRASKPYYIENISTPIYSIEELCFYLYENICLIDETIVNEALCDWIRDELGLKKLYRQLYEQLDKQEGIGYFILPIFREIGYLTPDMLREVREETGIFLPENAFLQVRVCDDDRIAAYQDGTVWRMIIVLFRAVLEKEPLLHSSRESAELRFFTPEELKTLPIVSTHRDLVEAWRQEKGSPC